MVAGSKRGQHSAGAALGFYWISPLLLAEQGPVVIFLQSCLKDVQPRGQVIEVFNWRGPRPGEGDPPELQCTEGSHWLAACGAKPLWLSLLQCGAALDLT